MVARRFAEEEKAETTLFAMGLYIDRAWVANLSLTAAGIWHSYDGRAGMERRIRELPEDFALGKIPTASFAANALLLEIIRLAYDFGHCVSTKLSRRPLTNSHAPITPLQVIPHTR